MDSTQVYSFQSPDSYMTFYTMDSIYPQIHGNSIINNNNNNNNLNDDNNSNSNNNNNVFNVPSLGADDFRRVAIPERNKIQSTVKPKSSLTLLLESRPDHPNICDHPNDNEDNYCLEYSTLNNSQIVSSSLPLNINKNSQASNNNNNNNNNNDNHNDNYNDNHNDNHNDINNSNSKINDSDIGGLTGTISFTDLIHLVTEEENNLSKSQCDIFPTEEDGSVIDYLPDISKNQSILDFGLQDFVVVDKVSSKPLMHVHIGIKSTPSPNLEVPIKNAIPIPNNLTPLVMNDRISSSGSNSVATNHSYYTDQRERAASESALGPITIYYKKVGQDNWNVASKKLNDQLSASTSSSTPTSVSSYHVRGLKQKYLHSGIAKSMPEERLDSSLYSPVRQLSNDNDNDKNININNPTPKSSNVSNIQMPKMQMMKNSPFAFCHNISSSDSSDDSDDDENKDKTWGYSH